MAPSPARAWDMAGAPTRREPSSVKATQEGVVRSPSLLANTCAAAPPGVGAHAGGAPQALPVKEGRVD